MNSASGTHTHSHTRIDSVVFFDVGKKHICLFALIFLLNSAQSIKMIWIYLKPIISLYENLEMVRSLEI